MKHPELIAMAGIFAMLLGGALRYSAARARFWRRNPMGLLAFQTYPGALAFQTANRAADRAGWWLLALGGAVSVAGMIGMGGH